MPRTPEQNKNIKDKRRGKLLSYAIKAFAANGYDHTAIDDITKLAKCSHGLFYHYFDSKERVFSALIDDVLTKENEFPAKEALSLGGVQGLRLLADYAEKVVNGSARERDIAKITLSLASAHGLDAKGKKFALEHDLYSTLVTLIKEGQQEGKVIAGDPREIATAFCDLVLGGLSRLGTKSASFASPDVLFAMALKGPALD